MVVHPDGGGDLANTAVAAAQETRYLIEPEPIEKAADRGAALGSKPPIEVVKSAAEGRGHSTGRQSGEALAYRDRSHRCRDRTVGAPLVAPVHGPFEPREETEDEGRRLDGIIIATSALLVEGKEPALHEREIAGAEHGVSRPGHRLNRFEVDREADRADRAGLFKAMSLTGRDHQDRSAIDREGAHTEMLHARSTKIQEDLGEPVEMLPEFLDPRHVLVQSDPADRESRPANLQVLEEDGLEFLGLHEIDIGFVLIEAKIVSLFRLEFASLFFMITDPADLKPSTTWEETVWSRTPEETLVDHVTNSRLCVATLLPFRDGKPDWEGFENSIRWMISCAEAAGVEIAFVLNADTGYIFNLSLDLYGEVIRRFRAAFPEPTIICGSTATGASGDTFQPDWYRPHFEIAQSFNKVEMMIMTSKLLNELGTEKRRDAYFEIAEMLTVPGIVHALEPAFVPWATPYGPWLLHELANHPRFVGGKISTLDEPHFLYWASMCRDLKLDFAPHSGDDFGIASAIKMGLPLLIGAGVSACPLICEAKRMWTCDPLDTRVFKLFEAFQSLEDAVFRLDARGSAAAYKHSTAHVLKLLGLIASSEIHPDCPDIRPADEADRMREALVRPLRIAERLGIGNFRLA